MALPRTPSEYGQTLGRSNYQAKLRKMRREETRDTLPFYTLTVGLLLLAIAPIPVLLFAIDGAAYLTIAVVATGLIFLVLRASLVTAQMSPRFSHPVAFVLSMMVLLLIGAQLVLTEDPAHSAYLILLLVGTSFIVGSLPILLLVATGSLGVYTYTWVIAGGGPEWIHFGVALGVALALAILFALGRDRSLRSVLSLRLKHEHHLASMARAIQATNESEIRFRRLAQAAFEGIILHDNGKILDANESVATLIGSERAGIIGRRLSEIVHVKDPRGIEGLLRAHTDHPSEYLVQRADGAVVLLEARGGTIPYRGGEARVLALRDLTEERRVETERRQLAKRLEGILESAGEGVIGVDVEGRSTFVNSAALDALGYTSEEFLGKDLHSLVHSKGSDGPLGLHEECKIANAYRHGHRVTTDDEVFWRRDGAPMPIEYTASPIHEDGNTTGAVIVFHDISERLGVERMKDELISVVSHELKTPLTSIHGSLRLLAAGKVGTIPPPALRMVTIAEKNTHRLMRLINDILDIERLQAGRTPLQQGLVRLPGVVEEAIETMRGLATDQGVDVETPDLPDLTLWCDRDRVLQCLTNLVSNAIKFSPQGSRVEIDVQTEPGRARFLVKDRGPGIPPELQDRLFRRFSQLDSSDAREKGGTGLGLAIAKEIVERHGGEIGHTPRSGGGTIFFFTIPLAKEQKEDPQ